MKHNINSQNTKIMLSETLLCLLNQKSLSKITISEIVSICNINRKTFYYHFSDVYDLFEWYLNEELPKIVNKVSPPLNNINATLSYSVDYIKKNIYLRNSIDTPIGRDKIVKFLTKNISPQIREMMEELEKRYQKTLEADFKDFLVKSLTHITVLSIIDAIENPSGYDIERMKLYLSDVFEASIEGFFQKLS